MRRFLVILILSLSAAAARAQTVEWSDWYEDPKVPGIALRQRCDPGAQEIQVEIRNGAEGLIMAVENAMETIQGYKGAGYELMPGQTVRLARPTHGCQAARKFWFRSRVEEVEARGSGEFKGHGRMFWLDCTLEEGKFSIRTTDYFSSHKKSWCRPVALECSSPAATEGASTSAKPPESPGEGYTPRPGCVRVSLWEEAGVTERIGHAEPYFKYHASAINTCEAPVQARICSGSNRQYRCMDYQLDFGETRSLDRIFFGAGASCTNNRILVWAAEGGKAAKRWVKSHRPETILECFTANPPAMVGDTKGH